MKHKLYKWLFLLTIAVGVTTFSQVTAQCPVTLHNVNGTSGNARAPMGNFRYERSVYLITASELAAAGIPANQNLASIGWVYSTAASVAVTGNLTIYMENTNDVANTKSTTWTTAITGMTNVFSSAYILPGTPVTTFDVMLTTPFNYTGGGLYVAFEWNNPGSTSTSCVVSCNTNLTNGLKGGQSNISLPATLASSSFRPVTRIATAGANDARVDLVYTLGSMPVGFTTNHIIQAKISNIGSNPLTGLNVTLNISGANSFTDVYTIPSLASCASTIISFNAFTPSATGTDNLSVSVPNDDNNQNNSIVISQPITSNLYSYKYAAPLSGGVGFNAGVFGVFVSKFNTALTGQVNEVKVDFQASSASRQFRIAIYDELGGQPNNLLYVSPSVISISSAAQQAFIPISPTVSVSGNFFVGVVQETSNTVNIGFSYQTEDPVRASTFFYTNNLTGGPWTDFSPGAPFRSAIEVQFYLAQPPNCPIMNAPADLTSACINGTTLDWASGGGGPLGYKLTFGTNAPSYDNILNDVDLGNVTSYSTGVLAAGTYGWKVTAYNNDGTSAGCSFKTFTTNLASCYCIPDYTSGTVDGDYISLVQIPTTTLNNSTAGSNTAPYYTLFPQSGSTTATLVTGNQYTINLAGGTYPDNYIRVWIDFNQDGVFSPSESIGVTGNVGSLTTGNFVFTVPMGAIPGTTRMRVRSTYYIPGPADTDACSSLDYGETEDYDLTIMVPPPCAGSPSPGNTASSVNPACSGQNFTLSLPNLIPESGLDYQWQSSPDGITYSNIIGANSATYTTNISSATYFHCIVTCMNSGQSSTSSAAYITVNPFYTCYCMPDHYGCDIGIAAINNVTINTLNNTTGCSGNAYSSYPQSGNTTTTLAINQTYPLSVTTDEDGIISVWIDYNQDGVFSSSEWTQVTTSSTAGVPSTVNITIPITALTGTTGMRIRSRLAGFQNGSGDACIYMGSGEAEDYLIEITCGAIASSNEPLCEGQQLSLSGSYNGSSTPVTWEWSGPNGYSAFTQNATRNNMTLADAGTYTLTVTDAASCSSTTTVSVNVAPLPVITPITNAPVCIGEQLNVGVNPSGMLFYEWSGPNGFSSFTQNPTVTNSASQVHAGIYTVTVTSSFLCQATATVQVVVNPRPVPYIINQTNVSCYGGNDGSVTIGSSGQAPYLFDWNFGLAAGDSTTISNLSAQTFSVTVYDGNGCQSDPDLQVTITEPTQLSASAGSNSPINSGQTLMLTSSVSGGTPGYSYSWTGPNGFTDNSANPSISNAPVAATGTYYVVVTDANGCTLSASVSVTVTMASTANISGGGPLCLGNSGVVTLTFTGTPPWSGTVSDGINSVNFGPTNNTTENVSVTPVTGGTRTYTITAFTDPNGPGISSGSAVFIVSTAPPLTSAKMPV
ncbi:MAG: PKD domain-containing protein, partial [Bacteroidia bacterium]|nr:PKD domain-containing protein [Bacteroidia bacterium]